MNNDAVGYHVAQKVARYLGVPVEALLNGVPEELEKVLRDERRRWSAPVVAWARKLAETFPEERTEEQWTAILDEAEKRLDPIIRNLTTKRR